LEVSVYAYYDCPELTFVHIHSVHFVVAENVVGLLSAASHVQMLPAVAACERYLCDHVTLSSVMAMEYLADLYSLAGLTRTVQAYMCSHWTEFITTPNFLALTARQLLAILKSDFPVFCSEIKVLESVFAWIDHSIPDRIRQCEDLLRAVRWENTTAKEVGQVVSTASVDRVMRACPRVLKLVQCAFPSLVIIRESRAPAAHNVSIVNVAYSKHSHQALPRDLHRVINIQSTATSDANSNVVVHAVVADGDDGSSSVAPGFRSTIRVNSTSGSTLITHTNGSPAGGVVNNREKSRASKCPVPGVVNTRGFLPTILVVGGLHHDSSPDSRSNDIACLQPGSDKLVPYTTIPHLPQTDFGMTVIDNQLYVVGGCCNEDFSEVTHPYVFRFNPVTAAWTSLPPMSQERCRFYLGSIGSLLYAVGGEVDNSQMLASCEMFDPQRVAWSSFAPLPRSRSELAGCTVGGKLYVSGGESSEGMVEQIHNEVWCYDPAADAWSTKSPMLTARADHSMVAHHNKVFVLGGWNLSDGERVPVTSVDCYDVEANTWQTVQHMKTPRRYSSCTLLEGRVYVVGGGWEAGVRVREWREVDVLDLDTLQWQNDVVSVPTIWEHSAVAIHLPRKP
jgi:N-acetylneuraminic acid mutarotase